MKVWVRALLALGILTVFALLLTPTATAASISGETSASGEANCFEITDSAYLNVSLCSSEVVSMTLESVPDVVSYTLMAVGDANSTEIELRGLEPAKGYYRYQDGHGVENFTADENGTHSYVQDVSDYHHVFLSEHPSTKYIRDNSTGGDCLSIGTWNTSTKTCKLTMDVNETIVLDSSGVTLDGDGHSVTVPSSYGIFASGKSNLTVLNTNVSAANGIFLSGSLGPDRIYGNRVIANRVLVGVAGNGINVNPGRLAADTISGNNVSGGAQGIRVFGGIGNTVANNTVAGSFEGLILSFTFSSNVTGNSVSGASYGLGLYTGARNLLSGNTVVGSVWGLLVNSQNNSISNNTIGGGVELSSAGGNVLSNNTITRTILLAGAIDNTISNNSLTSSFIAIQLYQNSNGNTISGNDLSAADSGIYLDNAPKNRIIANSIRNAAIGIRLWYGSGQNTVTGNNISLSSFAGFGISVYLSDGNALSANTVAARLGVRISVSNGATVSENSITADSTYGFAIQIGQSSGSRVFGNTIASGRYAIHLVESSYVNLTGNAMATSGIFIEGTLLSQWNTHTIDATNTIGGKPVYYWKNATGGTIPVGAGEVILANTESVTVEDQNFSVTPVSILLGFSPANIIRNNGAFSGPVLGQSSGAFGVGIYLYSSGSNVLSGNNVTGTSTGIFLWNAGNNTLSDNNVSGGTYGIYLSASGNNTLSDNNVSGGTYGILVSSSAHNTLDGNKASGGSFSGGSYGILVSSSANNTISGNDFSGSRYGVYIFSSDGTTVSGTAVSVSRYGISVYNSIAVTLFKNNVSASINGLQMGSAGSGTIDCNNILANSYPMYVENSNGNRIAHNNLRANQFDHLYIVGSSNTWDDSAGVGNHWANYAGYDDGSGGRTAGDGIGDTSLPHEGVDSYPVMKKLPCGNLPPEIGAITADDPTPEGSSVAFNASATDAESDALTYSWDFDDDGTFEATGTSNTSSHVFADDGVYTVTLKVCDEYYGGCDERSILVHVTNVDPTVDNIAIYVSVNITLRISGEKWHDVCAELWDYGMTKTAEVCLVRTAGSPNEQSVTLGGARVSLLGNTSILLRYTPVDDAVNGNSNGANPATVTLGFADGSTSALHHTFNAKKPVTWVKTWTFGAFQSVLVGEEVSFEITIADVGADDLTITVDFGDGTNMTIAVPHDGSNPTSATVTATHTYAATGTYDVHITVADDDGGATDAHRTVHVG